jgi:hypothetical protein
MASIIIIHTEDVTTAEFAASPTLAVPLLEVNPLKQPTKPMANPNRMVLKKAGSKSL